MGASFLTFERFNDPALAAAVAEKLKENGIEANPDEWGYFNFALAKKILADRGKSVR